MTWKLWPRNPYVATHYDSPASHVYKRLREGLQTSFDLVQSFIQVLTPHSPPLRRFLDLRTPVCPAQNLKTLQKVESLLSTAQPAQPVLLQHPHHPNTLLGLLGLPTQLLAPHHPSYWNSSPLLPVPPHPVHPSDLLDGTTPPHPHPGCGQPPKCHQC